MQYNRGPNVIESYPSNYGVGVPVDAKITVNFDIDLSKSSIVGNVHLYDKNGKEIDTRLTYSDKILTITPRENLQGSSTYRLVLHGDNDPNNKLSKKGLTTPLGDSMLGDYAITFTTFSNNNVIENVINGSPHNVMINSKPVIKFDVTNNTGKKVASAQVQISPTNTFDQIIWDSVVSYNTVKDEGAKPNVELKDGLYYWRARIKDQDIYGNWSDTFTFNINTVEQLPIVDEDTVPIDSSFPDDWNLSEPDVISITPTDNASNVSINTKTIAIVIDQILPKEKINEDMILLTGEPVDNDDTSVAHGIVDGIIDIAYNNDENTTTILFSLPDIVEEGGTT